MRKLGIVKFVMFNTLAEANASDLPLRFNEFAVIKGDGTRFKRGNGTSFGDGSTFSELPWSNSEGILSLTPFTTYAANATATLTAAQLIKKYITSTSAAATNLTLPTATLLGAALAAVKGTVFEFEIDNSAGANTVTLVLGAGMTQSGLGLLTVPSGTIGNFKLIFTSPTAAILQRTVANVAVVLAGLTDNSGGAAADGTIGVITAPDLGTWDGATVFPSAAQATAISDAVIASRDAVKELATKLNALIADLKTAGLMASA